MGCLYEIYRDVPAPSTDHGVGRDIWRAIFSAGAGGGGIVGAVKGCRVGEISPTRRQRLNFQQNSLSLSTVGHLYRRGAQSAICAA